MLPFKYSFKYVSIKSMKRHQHSIRRSATVRAGKVSEQDNNAEEGLDSKRRAFLKLMGLTGAAIIGSQILPKKTEALILGGGPSKVGNKRLRYSVSSNTTAGAATTTDYVYLVSGTTTITMPSPVGNKNCYTVKNVGSGTVTISPAASETFDASASISLPVQYSSVDLISDGTNWNVL
jgi:hypothetical protein